MIKTRESYRPFAPAVLEEAMGDLFEVPKTQADYSFMSFVLKVKPAMRDVLAAVTHVDGTARVQSVSRLTNPSLWDLITNFYHDTGVPAVLNTSFNNNIEPIVDSMADALTCYITTQLDYLIIDSFLISRLQPLCSDSLGSFRVSLPLGRKLVQRPYAGGYNYMLESNASNYFASALPLSPDLFALLANSNGQLSLTELFDASAQVGKDRREELTEELISIWKSRGISIKPSNAVGPPVNFSSGSARA
jgi:carbamoyltransferase